MEYEEMRRMEKTHWCAQCEAPLITIWDMFDDCYKLVCSHDSTHQGYKEIPTLSQVIARGGAHQRLGRGAQKDLEKMAEQGAPALSKLPEKDIASGEPITGDRLAALLAWGRQLGLKPYLGHVCLYFGKPYVTIDGYYYLMGKRRNTLRIGTRPTSDEEKTAWGAPSSDIVYLAEAWEKGEKLPTTGLGIVTRDEIEGRSTRRPEEFRAPVVHDHPQRMAEKRAEWQLLRKLIPLEETGGQEEA